MDRGGEGQDALLEGRVASALGGTARRGKSRTRAQFAAALDARSLRRKRRAQLAMTWHLPSSPFHSHLEHAYIRSRDVRKGVDTCRAPQCSSSERAEKKADDRAGYKSRRRAWGRKTCMRKTVFQALVPAAVGVRKGVCTFAEHARFPK